MESGNANIILPRLWLGNKQASVDETFLHNNNITVVFNCTKDLPFSPNVSRKYRVPVDDNLEPREISNMGHWAAEIVMKVIMEYKRGNSILIHCYAGMQRSAAVMAMVLIVLTKQPIRSIISFIREKRPVAFFPAINFERSILTFESEFHRSYSRSIV
jgi:protein-tyrosine phosphatase